MSRSKRVLVAGQQDVWVVEDPSGSAWEVDVETSSADVPVITETASQAGHLDAAREILDGRQWVLSLQPQRRSSNVLPTGPSCCRSKTVRPSASARIRPTGMVIRPSPIAWRTWCRRRRRSGVATIIPP